MEPLIPIGSTITIIPATAVPQRDQNQAFQDLINRLLGMNLTPSSRSSENADEAAIQAAIQAQEKREELEQKLSFAMGNAEGAQIAMADGPKNPNGLPSAAQQEYYFWNLQVDYLEAEGGPLSGS